MGSSSSTTKKKNAATNVVKTSSSQNQNNSSANQHQDNSSSANQQPDHNSTANQKPGVVQNSESQGQHNSTANQHPDNNSSANQQAGHDDSANQKPDSKKLISPIATDSSSSSQESAQTVKTQSVNKSTVMDSVDRWQDADLANLIGGLSTEDVQSKWEDLVDQLVSRYDPKVIPEKERKGWKTVRLFVSSTFKDMWNERDHLVKKVFPQLRQWCEERKLRLVECDLRWGVPKDADTRETLLACLSEIDRCREENGYPYFLNLTSERYGWVPKMNEVPEDIRAKYKLIPGLSVTASEIMVGGYWDRNTNALYMLRTPSYLEQVEDKSVLSAYTESDPACKDSLNHLKDMLRSKYPGQVHDYTCKVDNIRDGKLYLSGLEDLAFFTS